LLTADHGDAPITIRDVLPPPPPSEPDVFDQLGRLLDTLSLAPPSLPAGFGVVPATAAIVAIGTASGSGVTALTELPTHLLHDPSLPDSVNALLQELPVSVSVEWIVTSGTDVTSQRVPAIIGPATNPFGGASATLTVASAAITPLPTAIHDPFNQATAPAGQCYVHARVTATATPPAGHMGNAVARTVDLPAVPLANASLPVPTIGAIFRGPHYGEPFTLPGGPADSGCILFVPNGPDKGDSDKDVGPLGANDFPLPPGLEFATDNLTRIGNLGRMLGVATGSFRSFPGGLSQLPVDPASIGLAGPLAEHVTMLAGYAGAASELASALATLALQSPADPGNFIYYISRQCAAGKHKDWIAAPPDGSLAVDAGPINSGPYVIQCGGFDSVKAEDETQSGIVLGPPQTVLKMFVHPGHDSGSGEADLETGSGLAAAVADWQTIDGAARRTHPGSVTVGTTTLSGVGQLQVTVPISCDRSIFSVGAVGEVDSGHTPARVMSSWTLTPGSGSLPAVDLGSVMALPTPDQQHTSLGGMLATALSNVLGTGMRDMMTELDPARLATAKTIPAVVEQVKPVTEVEPRIATVPRPDVISLVKDEVVKP
jgi:hypothetical protein